MTFNGHERELSAQTTRDFLKQASIGEIDTWFETKIARITEGNPKIGTYLLFQALAQELPERIPAEARHCVFEATTSFDHGAIFLGRKTLPFLLTRHLLSAVDYCALKDDLDEKDDSLQEAILITTEIALEPEGYNPDSLISSIRTRLTTYNAQKYDIPRPLVATSASRVLLATVDGVLGNGTRRLSTNEIEDLTSELSRETNIPEPDLKDYLVYKTRRESMPITENSADNPEDMAEKHDLKEQTEIILCSLWDREKMVLKLRFGFLGKEKTREEIAKQLHIDPETVKRDELQALKTLKRLRRNPGISDYIDPDREPNKNPQSLMNGALTAFYQEDYARAEANLTEIEDLVYESLGLSNREKVIMRSSGYKPKNKSLIFFQREGQDSIQRGELDRLEKHIPEIIERLREVWILRSKIPNQ